MAMYKTTPWENSSECTIVIPTYNNKLERFIELFNSLNTQCCHSLLRVILVNDGSTDWPGDAFIGENLHLEHEIITLAEN